MVDNDKDNDEYQYLDMDAASTASAENLQSSDESAPKVFSEKPSPFQLDTKRKALIVVLLLIFSIVIYKWINSSFSSNKEITAAKTVAAKETPKPVIMQQPTQAIIPETTTTIVNVDERVGRQLSDLEQGQQKNQADFLLVNSQINGINTSMTGMIAKIDELSRVVAQLTAKIEAEEIARAKPRVVTIKRARSKNISSHRPTTLSTHYYIQAVIPGRAWLVATNGSTLTVREGTNIAGYGMVKLIDPRQGRVLTSSGQVIRFSPEDS